MSAHTIVVKLGTSTLTNGTDRLSRPAMLEIIRQIAQLHTSGHRIVLVSSGAMAAGKEVLGNPALAQHLPIKQMLCAVGQGYLMNLYSTLFGLYDIHIGQILITHDDLRHRIRYLNARNTLTTLLENGVIPIVNENDTLAVDEIRVGDNDNLSAYIAGLIDADYLIILTDQDGLYDQDPRKNPEAHLIRHVHKITERIWALASDSTSGQGTGGMITKIQAAQLATRSGTRTIIARGTTPNVLIRLLDGESIGTTFEPTITHLESRKRWLLAEKPHGTLIVDQGAAHKLQNEGASLLPIGILHIRGDFERGDIVLVTDEEQHPIAQGLANYGASELTLIKRRHSRDILDILEYTYGDEAIHRDHM
ncbi:MAG: glutamate 5-kinase, partial [Phototrophicales bacterium]